tara:strand:- start:25740 stop:26117 length:378 start_codon:yes stop_codon:yes gene_type:complete
MHKVFVYGSLKRGFGNHRVIEASTTRFLGVGSLADGVMYSLGGFPGVIRGKGEIQGELYEVDDATLGRLDCLEGHPTFYERQDMEVQTNEGRVACQGYIYQGDVSYMPHIESGDWSHGAINRRIR